MNRGSITRLRAVAGIDFHVGATLLFRVWSLVAGGVMVLVIPLTVSPQEQGYYYTFASLLGLQIFFELGLNQVVLQIVSHEMAHLSFGADGQVAGDARHVDRLKSIVALLRKWYRVAAVLFWIVTSLAGAVLFERAGSLPRGLWLGPWIALVALTSINLYASPILAVTEGCGRVGQVARLRLVQSMLGHGLAWLALAAGAGLWAIPLIAGVAALLTLRWLSSDRHLLRAFDSEAGIPPDRGIDWRREVFPFQWRIAVSWISGYLIFQLFTPLTFVHLGAVAAGKLGIALTIFSALLSVGVSWINAKTPLMSAHIARGERRQLDQIFRAVMIRSVGFVVAACAAVLAGVAVLTAIGMPQVARIADFPTLVCIALATCANVVVYGAAAYMRSHRVEPMLPVSVAGGLLVMLTSWFASQHSSFLTMLLQAAVTCLLSLPWTLLLFRKFRRAGAAR